MAMKRSTRMYVDDMKHGEEVCLPQMSSSYLSRRDSWNSLDDGMEKGLEDREAGQRNCSMSWESQAISSRSQSIISNSKETSANIQCIKTFEKSIISISSSPSTSDSPDYPTSVSSGRPVNFGLVVPGVYRSSYPKPEDYNFLRGLKLKTIVTLVKKDELDHDLLSFISANGINQVVFNMKGTKKETIPICTMRAILEMVLDRKNYPLLVHCNHGKHRTGCVIAVIRKLSGWQSNMVVDEYKSYAEPKLRDCDIEYINSFQCASLQGLYDWYIPPAQVSPVQVRSFFRALLFSTFVMVIWLVSSLLMPLARDKTALQ